MMSDLFILDTSVFVTAQRTYYPYDIAPGFWKALIWHHLNGDLCSADRVLAEIRKQDDELTAWTNTELPAACFCSTTDQSVVGEYAKLQNWAVAQSQYNQAAKSEFADGADAWLISLAQTRAAIVVTEEKSRPDAKARIFIPDVCREFKVHCIDTFTLLRKLGTKLDWSAP